MYELKYKLFTLLLLCFISLVTSGQKYRTADIVKKADSVIAEVVGQVAFQKYFRLDTFRLDPVQLNIDKEQGIQHVNLTAKTTKNFKLIAVTYVVFVPQQMQPIVSLRVVFNCNLMLYHPFDTAAIPHFMLRRTENDFLTREQALKNAKLRFKKEGKMTESRIYFDPGTKDFIWEITNVIQQFGSSSRQVESVKINAQTGEFITFLEALEGQLH